MFGISAKKLIGIVLLLVGIMMLIELVNPLIIGITGGDFLYTIIVAVVLCILGTWLSKSKTVAGKKGYKP